MTGPQFQTPLRRDAPWRALARWLSVAALVFQAFFPLLHQPQAVAGGADGTVVICTGYGFKVVPAADLGFAPLDEATHDTAPATWCLACFASHLPAAVVASPVPTVLPAEAPALYAGVQDESRPPAATDHRRPPPRAPPIVA